MNRVERAARHDVHVGRMSWPREKSFTQPSGEAGGHGLARPKARAAC